MVKCSTLRKLFHKKGAQNNGEKNKVKSFFNKKNVPRRKIVPQPGRAGLFHDDQNVPQECSTKTKLFHTLNKKD